VLIDAVDYICDTLTQEDHPQVDLGLVFGIYSTCSPKIGQDRVTIYKEIKFKPEYYEVLNYCISHYLNGKYNVVHLRLEDDWIKSGYFRRMFYKFNNSI
jgi:hypothetical protein